MSYVIEIANDRNGRLTAVEIVFFLRSHHRDSPTYRCRDHFFGCTINTIINCTQFILSTKIRRCSYQYDSLSYTHLAISTISGGSGLKI